LQAGLSTWIGARHLLDKLLEHLLEQVWINGPPAFPEKTAQADLGQPVVCRTRSSSVIAQSWRMV